MLAGHPTIRRVAHVAAALLVAAALPTASASAQALRASASFRIDARDALTSTRGASLAAPSLAALERSESWREQLPWLPSAMQRGSRTKYALWGGAIGGAIGLAVGIASYNNSRCTDCWVPNEAIPPYGFVVGATAGVLVGLLVHAMTPESSGSAR